MLLRALLAAWPTEYSCFAFLDARARAQLELASDSTVSWVEANICSRLKGEIKLRCATTAGNTVLCFHGLPPLLPNPGRVVVFQQNRNYLGLNPVSQFDRKTRLRLIFERFISWVFRHRVSEYIVQTSSMQLALRQWYGAPTSGHEVPAVRILPFLDELPQYGAHSSLNPKWDFVYVADGTAHKNHKNLLLAWKLLAIEGLYPSLALTLSERDNALGREVQVAREQANLKIDNLGHMSRESVMELYRTSRALIFPSTSESFGLPLIEASKVGLPILASELDYVRDVCAPDQTFDPSSPISIARAVKRFLGKREAFAQLSSPQKFWSALFK